jgi:hypothetical protein
MIDVSSRIIRIVTDAMTGVEDLRATRLLSRTLAEQSDTDSYSALPPEGLS